MKQIVAFSLQDDNGAYKADTLEQVVDYIREGYLDSNDIADYEFFELDLTTHFEVDLKPVRKMIPVVKKPKEKTGG